MDQSAHGMYVLKMRMYYSILYDICIEAILYLYFILLRTLNNVILFCTHTDMIHFCSSSDGAMVTLDALTGMCIEWYKCFPAACVTCSICNDLYRQS